jgi:DNA-directed RNA polymerase subunit alpha
MHQIQEVIGIPKIKPQVIEAHHVIFILSPLPPGYGMTVGNALRRVLLSSLPGAAVTAVKIEGINYEYATIPGVKESVLDMLLNLKLLRLKKIGKEPSVLKLNVNKAGKVTAKDIELPSEVELLNPDQYITTLEKGNKLNMEIRVEKGVGYVPANEHLKEGTDTDMIWTDSFFSPIKKVRYDVEDTRVGDMTNLNKLTIEIETDNSISPDDALKFSANILKSYFGLFNLQDVKVESGFMSDFASIAAKEKLDDNKKPTQESYTPIEILGLSPRTLNALINGEIGSIEQLTKCTESKLNNLRGFGKKALTEVATALEPRGLTLSED